MPKIFEVVEILDKELFEDQATHLQTIHNLNPLASKILVYLFWDFDKEGVTFDEITGFFGVSKSSVSTSIQLLQQMNLIESITKIDSRKRYFRLNQEHNLERRLQSISSKLQKEESIIKRFLKYLEERKIDDIRLQQIKIYIRHLEETNTNIQNTLQEMAEVESH